MDDNRDVLWARGLALASEQRARIADMERMERERIKFERENKARIENEMRFQKSYAHFVDACEACMRGEEVKHYNIAYYD